LNVTDMARPEAHSRCRAPQKAAAIAGPGRAWYRLADARFEGQRRRAICPIYEEVARMLMVRGGTTWTFTELVCRNLTVERYGGERATRERGG
jgi:hypothetical protein